MARPLAIAQKEHLNHCAHRVQADIESLAGINTSRGRRDEWTIDEFAASLGISRCISEALRHEDTGGSELELMKSFASRDAIQRRLVAGKLADRVADLLWEGEQKLLSAAASSGAQLNAKARRAVRVDVQSPTCGDCNENASRLRRDCVQQGWARVCALSARGN